MGNFTVMEIWKDIVGYERYYQVSNMGRIKRKKGYRCKKERILKPCDDGRGYLHLTLRTPEKKVTKTIHLFMKDTFFNTNKMYMDHINGNTKDNRLENLRLCTQAQNLQNSIKKKKGYSIYKGVCKRKDTGKWNAYICLNGRLKHLGFYKEEIEAARAYNEAAKENFKDFAKLNEI